MGYFGVPRRYPFLLPIAMSANVDVQYREAVKHYKAGSHELAADLCRRILARHPGHLPVTHLLGVILDDMGRAEESVQVLGTAAVAAPNDARVLYGLARAYANAGHLQSALDVLEKTRTLNPENPAVPTLAGTCLLRAGRPGEAAGQYEEALRLDPGNASLYRTYGECLSSLARFDEAIAAFRDASRLRPDDIQSRARLARLYERTNRLDEMEAVLSDALANWPANPELRYLKAVISRRRGEEGAALELLTALCGERLEADLERRVLFEAAAVLDRQGRHGEAFQRVTRANRLTKVLAERNGQHAAAYGEWLDRVHDQFQAAWSQGLPASESSPHETVVFIFSFPRSGTTLIDSLLACRGEFQVYEEKGFIDVLIGRLKDQGIEYPEQAANLPVPVIEDLRRSYFAAANRFARRRPGTVIVDKNPMLTPALPLLQQVFPDAKYIFAARHPLDVCLSCYMYNFSPGSALANYDQVDDLATAYAKSLRIWRLAESHLQMDTLQVRYEDLVDDLESESRNLFDFLEVEWDEKVLDFARLARTDGRIIMRNYDKIIQGLYRSSKHRWINYERELAPAIPVLKDAMEYLGYRA